MATGDGLLARLAPDARPVRAWSQLGELCMQYGNGQLEVTSRGSVQVRGLDPSSCGEFAERASALGFRSPGTPTLHQDLDLAACAVAASATRGSGSPASLETNAPLELLDRLGRILEQVSIERELPAKTSLVFDTGIGPGLDRLRADVRLRPLAPIDAPPHRFPPALRLELALRGDARSARRLGSVALEDLECALSEIFEALETRSRLNDPSRCDDVLELARPRWLGALPAATRLDSIPEPTVRADLGRHPLGATVKGADTELMTVELPFGTTSAEKLREFAEAAAREGATWMRAFAPHSIAVFPLERCDPASAGGRCDAAAVLADVARELGWITAADAKQRRLHACVGAPGCASAHIATRSLAREVFAGLPDLDATVYVAGCSKHCGRPEWQRDAGPLPGPRRVEITGTSAGCEIHMDGERRGGAVPQSALARRVRALLGA